MDSGILISYTHIYYIAIWCILYLFMPLLSWQSRISGEKYRFCSQRINFTSPVSSSLSSSLSLTHSPSFQVCRHVTLRMRFCSKVMEHFDENEKCTLVEKSILRLHWSERRFRKNHFARLRKLWFSYSLFHSFVGSVDSLKWYGRDSIKTSNQMFATFSRRFSDAQITFEWGGDISCAYEMITKFSINRINTHSTTLAWNIPKSGERGCVSN